MTIKFPKKKNYTTKDYEHATDRLDEYVEILNKLLFITEDSVQVQCASLDLKNKTYACYRRLLQSVASSKYRNEKSITRVFNDAMEDLEELLEEAYSDEEIKELKLKDVNDKEFK